MGKKSTGKVSSVVAWLLTVSVSLAACGGTERSGTGQEGSAAGGAAGAVMVPVHTERAAAVRFQNKIHEAAQQALEAWNTGIGEYAGMKDPDVRRCLQELDRQKLIHPDGDVWMREDAGKEEDTFIIRELGGYHLPEEADQELQNMLASVYAPGFTMGFVMMDLHTGEGICYNLHETYYSASSSKASFVTSLVKARPDVADKQREYLTQITVNSDNDRFFELEYDYGQDIHRAYADAVGVGLELDDGGFADISAEDLTRLWLANYDYFRTGEMGDLVGSWFETPVYSAIVPVVGGAYVTRTKPGWIAGMLHNASIDAGIVYADAHPYILIVMSDFPSYLEDLEETVELLDRIHDGIVSGMTEETDRESSEENAGEAAGDEAEESAEETAEGAVEEEAEMGEAG